MLLLLCGWLEHTFRVTAKTQKEDFCEREAKTFHSRGEPRVSFTVCPSFGPRGTHFASHSMLDGETGSQDLFALRWLGWVGLRRWQWQ